MKREVLIAGFGGQGVMSIGKSLAELGMDKGLFVSWVPSYGPEMRGGTANCSVILSDAKIGSPIVTRPTELIAMNMPALDKFGTSVREGGTIFLNAPDKGDRVLPGVTVCPVPCDEIAGELGNLRAANMVMLGAYAAVTGFITPEEAAAYVRHLFGGRKSGLIELNLKALERGAACRTA
ncbi:MAG TPA: 2-oxoacid:acceptor oxidoreductase family protein [Terriglobales bacterium]|nr:2-oxoacid:acceptor oxidoreductase family protein [Terriglobales bacterium]